LKIFIILVYATSLIFTQLIARDASYLLITAYTLSFASFLYLILSSKFENSFLLLVVLGIAIRAVFIFTPPLLSDDFYRFVWDANLSLQGLNPYAHTPIYVYSNMHMPWMYDIYHQLNSKDFYTVYPAVCQYVSIFSAFIIPHSIHASYVIKSVFFLAEVGSILTMIKILEHFHSAKTNVLLYALNPLVLLETVGNIHFDGLAIFFILLTIYAVLKNKYILAGVFIGLAIGSKLTPLMLLPFFVFSLPLRKILISSIAGISTLILLHLPYLYDLPNIDNSISLYYDYFEFNASIYYLVKMFFVQIDAYLLFEKIKFLFPLTAAVSIIAIQYILRGKELINIGSVILFTWLMYFLFSTTVHPWYILIPVAAMVLSKFRFPLIWSLIIFFTYMSYMCLPVCEKKWLVLLEYLLLICVIIVEYKRIQEPKFAIEG